MEASTKSPIDAVTDPQCHVTLQDLNKLEEG